MIEVTGIKAVGRLFVTFPYEVARLVSIGSTEIIEQHVIIIAGLGCIDWSYVVELNEVAGGDGIGRC